jgi:hypothetical protein
VKIKVRSKFREVIAVTGRIWEGGNPHLQFRQFTPPHPKAQYGETYMTPAEANFLVESPQNQMHIAAGEEAVYSYPAGHPVPVHDSHDGNFHAPLTDKSFHISDSRQLDQSAAWMAERAASIELAKAKAAAEARGDDPDDVVLDEPEPAVAEGPGARRARQKADREAARVAAPL